MGCTPLHTCTVSRETDSFDWTLFPRTLSSRTDSPGEYFSPVLSRIYSLLDNFPTTIIISINAYIRMCIHVHTYIIYAHTYMHTNYTCIYARVLCMYVRTFAYVYYKHPYMHICIHMHT